VAQQALDVYGIEYRFFHLDSSSFHLHGQYSAEEPQIEAIEITHGFSKRAAHVEHRPDLKQVVVSLITGHRSQLPVWMEALTVNSSDKESHVFGRFPQTIQDFCHQLRAGDDCFMVVDSALYGAENLHSLGEIRWLTRVPETLAEAKRPLAETDGDQMTALPDGYAHREVPSDYGGIVQRWLVVYSPVAAQREEKTLQRREAVDAALTKEEKAAQKAWRQLVGQAFNCQKDAQAALAEVQKRWKYHQAAAQAVPLTRYPDPGRPAQGATPNVVGYQL
jgi:transposase